MKLDDKDQAKAGAECLPYRLRVVVHTWASYPCDGGFYPYGWSAGAWISGHLYYDRLDSILEFRGGFREMIRSVFFAIVWWI